MKAYRYTEELANEICERIASSSRGLHFICKDLNVTARSVYNWLHEYPDFREKYLSAREMQADFMADEMLEIADHGDKDTVIVYDKNGKPLAQEDREWTNRSRLRIDARKWIAAHLRPKKWGDKIDVTTDGEKITSVKVEIINTNVPLAGDEKEVKLD